MSQHIEELQDWLADLHQLVSSKTNQKEIEYAKKRIDSLEFLMEQNKHYERTLRKTKQRLLRLPWFKGVDAHVTISVITKALECEK